MRVDNNQPAGAPDPVQTRANAAEAGPGIEPGRNADSAEISTASRVLHRDRSQRVEELRLQVERGHYKINADTLASSLIDEAIETSKPG